MCLYREKDKKGNQQGCDNRRLGAQTRETMVLFCSVHALAEGLCAGLRPILIADF